MEVPDSTPQLNDTPSTPARSERRRTDFDEIQFRPDGELDHFPLVAVSSRVFLLIVLCLFWSYFVCFALERSDIPDNIGVRSGIRAGTLLMIIFLVSVFCLYFLYYRHVSCFCVFSLFRESVAVLLGHLYQNVYSKVVVIAFVMFFCVVKSFLTCNFEIVFSLVKIE